jgi:hypothetical protein
MASCLPRVQRGEAARPLAAHGAGSRSYLEEGKHSETVKKKKRWLLRSIAASIRTGAVASRSLHCSVREEKYEVTSAHSACIGNCF